GAFGCTNDGRELIAFVLEADLATRDRGFSDRYRIRISRSEMPETVVFFNALPGDAASAVDDISSNGFLDLIAAATGSQYVQLCSSGETQLPLVAQRITEGLAGYPAASLEGVIGRAARGVRTVWVPDVTKDPDYIAAEPSTRSELALPGFDADGRVSY